MAEQTAFKVIIVGGSVAGLVLAHCLDRANVDYVVLEKHQDLHPQLGAGLVVMPNGARILEQLGIFSDVGKGSPDFDYAHNGFPDGHWYPSKGPKYLRESFGLKLTTLERRDFLRIVYSKLKDKSRVHAGKGVVSILPDSFGVTVEASDGTLYRGDLVVGADGIHSVVRSEMWRVAETQQPGLITMKEKTRLKAEYNAVFGISNPIPGIKKWEIIIRYNDGFSIFAFPGQNMDVYWVVVAKMDKAYTYPNCPRYSKDEAAAFCESLKDYPVWQGVKFGDLWDHRRSFNMNPQEEDAFTRWHYGRIACIGDSISKMTPCIAQGANTAMEAAACLANNINAMLKEQSPGEKPGDHEISRMLASFNQTVFARLNGVHKESKFLTRYQACGSLSMYIFARYIAEHVGDLMARGLEKSTAKGIMLDYLPVTGLPGKNKDQQPKWHVIDSERGTLYINGLMAVFIILVSMLLAKLFPGVIPASLDLLAKAKLKSIL